MRVKRRRTGDDAVFAALAHPTRRRILETLQREPGRTIAELTTPTVMSRQALTQHLDVLAEAGLVASRWDGREKLHYVNGAALLEVIHGWTGQFDTAAARGLADLKARAEGRAARPESTSGRASG